MYRVHLIIAGDVQGVGYRSWVRGLAQDFRLAGWVKNNDDDTVEIVAEGPREKLRELVKRCQRGPDVAWVKKVDVTWEEATNEFITFEVIY